MIENENQLVSNPDRISDESQSPSMGEIRNETRNESRNELQSQSPSMVNESMGEIRNEDYSDETPEYFRDIYIKPLDSGYLVKVGCQSAAVETTESLIKALNDYLTRPAVFEKAWNKNKNRNKL